MSIALIVLLPLLGAVLPALMMRSGRNESTIAACSVTTLSLALLLTNIAAIGRSEVQQANWPWVPQIDLNASFFVDGLGLLFAVMILGIGLLVTVYARFYLGRKEALGRFFAYLLLFQGAMVGVVLSDNIILLMVFWELTSLSSFLLIGFKSATKEGRQGARMALTVTAGGGLALLAGMLLLGQVAGSFELTEILKEGDKIRSSHHYVPIVLLVLVGCFTKSAQFPFHFWLPQAMSAPTPVSAYLHSATMVKAGIFLMLRLWPVLAGTQTWFYVVVGTGLVTMLLAAIIALFRDDLKSILAYSTISHLGIMTMLIGLGSEMAVVACVFHVINHAMFKAALFMNAGIVDYETGTRDITRLGGLVSLMPISAVTAIFAAASMAGLPPMNGFLSKEMMLEEVVHAPAILSPWLLPGLVMLGSAFSVAYSLRFLFFTYFGTVRDDYPLKPRDPVAGLWIPPALFDRPRGKRCGSAIEVA
jgi:multicomponent K+:H+ antiporter subunit A